MSDVRNVIIIGGGPAGYTAALYTARANLEPLVIEGFNWGGQLMITSDVENYPGYADGVMGPTMMQDFRRQAERFGAEFVTDDVTRVDFSERPFRVYVGNDEYRADSRHRRHRRERPPARARVRAAAAGPRRLVLRDLRRRRSSATRSSWSSAAATRRWRRRPSSPASRARSTSSTGATSSAPRRSWSTAPARTRRSSSSLNKAVDEVLGDDEGRPACRLRDTVTGELSEIEADGFFVAIGHDPNTALFLDQLDHEDEHGLPRHARPSRPRRTSRACSPPATSRITRTGRPSRQPARAVRLRSTPSGT